jgi:hypothetical protein
VLLRHYPAPIVRIECRRCDRADHYRLAALIQRFGPAASLSDVLALLTADCPWQGGLCGAGYADSVKRQ